jgi:hypothetical protein
MSRRPRDLTGQTFGLLTALRPTAERRGDGVVVWLCRCACGRQARATSADLLRGGKRSCGCLPRGPGRGWRKDPAKAARRLAQARALRAQGLSLAEVGRRLGVSKQRVHHLLREGERE